MSNFENVALDALGCFVNAWANHEDEPFSTGFRGEMVSACDKAVKALNFRSQVEFEEQYATIERPVVSSEMSDTPGEIENE